MSALEQLMAPQTAQARERRVHGLVTAKVTSIDDDGAYRLEYLSMGDAQPSAPARVMMPMAGKKRGMHFRPDPGDEVVVGFELGDTSLPIILGGVWNNDSPAPDQAQPSPDNNVRTIVSRSNHELTFDDSTGSEKVVLKSHSGHEITLDDAPLGRTVTIKTAGGLTVTLDDKTGGSISISGPSGASIGINAIGNLSLSSPGIVEIKASMITLDATVIQLKTTGSVLNSMILMESLPFGSHVHILGAATTGPVLG